MPKGWKPGDRFEHARMLDPETRAPMLCEVTRIAQGVLYYTCLFSDGTRERKAKSYIPLDQTGKFIARRI
jgi:hypothetical protein